jgi:TetR/AcrR family transcriptional regulator
MTDTEQKILDAALKVFAEKGYKGATTKVIAEESGFSEFTLFRKFKSKRNLYETVLIQNIQNLKVELESVFIDEEFNNHRDFLQYIVKSLARVCRKNFEVFSLSLNEENHVLKPIMKECIGLHSNYIEKNLPNQEIDYEILGLTISSFIYMLTLEEHHGRYWLNYESALDRFIDNLDLSLR